MKFLISLSSIVIHPGRVPAPYFAGRETSEKLGHKHGEIIKCLLTPTTPERDVNFNSCKRQAH